MFKIQKLKIIIIAFILSFVAIPVFATEIYFDTKNQEITVNQQFKTDILLNTKNEEINAIEGKVIFPGDILELKEIRDANSIINLWIEQPKIDSNNRIVFSGVTPGGYKGEKGLLISLIFQAKKEGQSTIEISEAKALRNDGKGTPVSLVNSNFQFLVSEQIPIPENLATEIKDINSPEPFIPEIAHDYSIFEDKWFLAFITQDKETGINHYEIKETKQKILTFFSKWISTESPYLLKDQELKSYIFVKAIDGAGNKRIVKLSSMNPVAWYKNFENWFIIMGGIIIVCIAIRILWKKCIKNI